MASVVEKPSDSGDPGARKPGDARAADHDRPRLTAADWEQAALDLIAEQGVAAVAVEPLARRLGVTKGSFYWHFATRDALLEAALQRWERTDVEALMTKIDRIEDPRDRLKQLFRRTSHEMRTHVIYSALLKALDHPAVQPVMQRLSHRRINYLSVAYRALGLSRKTAMNRARLAYSAYVGFLQLILQLKLQRMEADEFEQYVEHVVETLIPPA
ncbi:MAG TPA: helix-turn-helix domain-containing protein [Xanthomonadales bacterium]|nr:helix-turn-helix domain-containing protein [Xanthomonadales bacterium]